MISASQRVCSSASQYGYYVDPNSFDKEHDLDFSDLNDSPSPYERWSSGPGPSSPESSQSPTPGNLHQSHTNAPKPQDKKTKSSQHAWIQRSPVTTSKALNHLVLEFSRNGVKSFFCGWDGCKHPVGFPQKPQLVTHIRSVHLEEKPFLCTACNTSFSRKQEASRHVLSMNSGRKYKCSSCNQAFARKNYRDSHEEICMCEGELRTHATTTQRAPNLPGYHSPPQSNNFFPSVEYRQTGY